jgi:DDE superfamily endonuclease
MSKRTLRRVLLEIGFSYQDVRKERNFVETAAIREWRAKYLQERKRIRVEEPNTIEIWLDESYCHQYHVARYSWYRGGDTVKRGNKGKRWIIVNAGGSCGWVGDPLVFEAKKKSSDYHDNMNWDTFRSYFEKLCTWMQEEFSDQKVVFHLDNASYHKKIDGLKRPLSKLKKAELQNWLKSVGAKEEDIVGRKRNELYALARDDPKYKGIPTVKMIAAKYGYQVLWLPPYHPTLNPIEEAWGLTKGYVARENNGSSSNNVEQLISGGFKTVTPTIWQKLVQRTYANEDKMIAEEYISVFTSKDINSIIANTYDGGKAEEGGLDEEQQGSDKSTESEDWVQRTCMDTETEDSTDSEELAQRASVSVEMGEEWDVKTEESTESECWAHRSYVDAETDDSTESEEWAQRGVMEEGENVGRVEYDDIFEDEIVREELL